jgi:hypothetical protein
LPRDHERGEPQVRSVAAMEGAVWQEIVEPVPLPVGSTVSERAGG